MHTLSNAYQLQEALFSRLGGSVPYHPYAWQREAFERLSQGLIPGEIVAPTAAGKTMLLPTYVAALARRALSGQRDLPRRLVFVVNRRVLVDEATSLCERVHSIVQQNVIPLLTSGLASLSASGVPLAVSTLRGEFEDNGQWSADPTTPAIILATPDMLGSRLLFRGYGGPGRNRAPLHAGLLGIDTLVIHDESHLAPAFGELLRTIEAQAAPQADRIGRPRLHVIEMTATLRPDIRSDRPPLVCMPSSDPALIARLSAPKLLRIETVESTKERERRIVSLVRERAHKDQAIAVFVASPAEAATLEHALTGGKTPLLEPERLVVLTGTMRGAERELLLAKPAWQRVSASRLEGGPTAVLIATGAGEIGIDLDADLLVCDEATLDRQIQRIGRCNRRGQVCGEVVVMPLLATKQGKSPVSGKAAQDLPARRAEATRLLRSLPKVDEACQEASPVALSALLAHSDYPNAIEPAPLTRELEAGVLDLFAATSHPLRELSAPDPALWIHGLVEDEPEINLVWRHLPQQGHVAWLEAWPLHRRECARLPLTAKMRHMVATLAAQGPALILDPGSQLIGPYGAIALPVGGYVLFDCGAGGLSPQGLPNEEARALVPDVSMLQYANGELAVHAITFGDEDGLWYCGEHVADSLSALIAILHPMQYCAWHEFVDGCLYLWLRAPESFATDSAELLTSRARGLTEHLELTARAAWRIARALNLPAELTATLVRAGRIHDEGKARPCWQHAIGNFGVLPLGKSGGTRFDYQANAGYRHELGSLADCEDSEPLVRQLVAAHHGHARPGAPAAALTHAGCATAAREASLGYATLSGEVGHWALAYLEALLKCADVMAERLADELSADPLPDTTPLHARPLATRDATVDIAFDPANPGEYLAALGLLWLVSLDNPAVSLAWHGGGCTYHGVDDKQMQDALGTLAGATAEVDALRAANMNADKTAASDKEQKYPPLILTLGEKAYPINAWCNERLSNGSSWKFALGQTNGLKTLRTLLAQCADSLPMTRPDDLRSVARTRGFTAKGKRPRGAGKQEVCRFRFDATTSWTSLDVGWSLDKEKMSFARPWIEVLALLGIQSVFPPPARREAPYYTWTEPMPLTLARIAARGLTPDRASAFQPQYRSSGDYVDAYTSIPLTSEGAPACTHLLII